MNINMDNKHLHYEFVEVEMSLRIFWAHIVGTLVKKSDLHRSHRQTLERD